jgi:hypothetical protein
VSCRITFFRFGKGCLKNIFNLEKDKSFLE